MNNNTTLYDGMSDENALIKDIEVWEDEEMETPAIADILALFKVTNARLRDARRLLTRAKELL